MIIIRNKIIPFPGYAAITIGEFVFVRRKVITDELRNHEAIHVRQWRELLYVFFIPVYVLEYLFRLLQYRNHDKAYRNISLEREAYDNERNPDYLKGRRLYSWRKYL